MKGRLLSILLASTLAQAASPEGLPEALKGIKPATGMCLRDAVPSSSATQPATAAARHVDVSCGIGVSDMVALSARQALTLVDVRDANAQAQATIDGSLRMSVAELHSKTFLRDRPLVLVGNGKGQRELMAACARLEAAGFVKPMVLLGGMPAWIAQRQPVVGLTNGADELPRLTSAELWMEGQFDANLIVVAEPLRSLQQRLPNAIVAADLSPTALKKALEQRRKSRIAVVASVIVASPSELLPAQQHAARDALRPVPVLYYVGTPEAFAKDMQRQSSMWAAHDRGPKQPGCVL